MCQLTFFTVFSTQLNSACSLCISTLQQGFFLILNSLFSFSAEVSPLQISDNLARHCLSVHQYDLARKTCS
ncbi:uncharacterized protein BYT42DRAFT_558181 [Radiomyces spectabilis]|uniref:uncharacterized protein n=1 Tax=Radiomyces spectabilis TaxID=64574 RepID=UPI00221EDF84|nr:uncharacterized protein BYT42DRAFT_558181 [Radiomyces spectabilis]KAI8391817.1 hypothetical protein BYT42DRAFT_558181 [Radiomyces spectabilis]